MSAATQTGQVEVIAMATFYADPQAIIQRVHETQMTFLLLDRGRLVCKVGPMTEQEAVDRAACFLGEGRLTWD